MLKLNSKENLIVYGIILIFSLIIYSNTLTFDYALDDSIVIKDNAFTKKGISGIKDIFRYDSFTGFFGKQKQLVAGGRYRPFSIATFALEIQFFGTKPAISHLINILLYALTGIMIYLLFAKLRFAQTTNPWYLSIPFITAIFFIAHPVHTEVVANIKGRDEIFALLFSLITINATLNYHLTNKKTHLIVASISFFLALLSKENAILFLILTPLTIHYFTNITIKTNFKATLPILAITLVFVIIRYRVLGYINSSNIPRELLNNPFVDAHGTEKIGTIFYTLGYYIKLLILPHPLTHDYYPYQIPLIKLSDLRALFPFLIYITLIIIAIKGIKKKTVISYGIIVYLLTLLIVSNLIVSVGTFMNERFIYMPSLGAILIFAWFIVVKLPTLIKNKATYQKVTYIALIGMLALGSIKTFSRNFVWKDDFTLFSTDVKVSKNSAKCNTSAGGQYLEQYTKTTDPTLKEAYYEKSLTYLNRAIALYPTNTNSLLLLGNAKFYKAQYHEALEQYMTILSFDPNESNAYQNSLKALAGIDYQKDPIYKFNISMFLFKINPNNADMNYNLGKIYGQFKGNLDSAQYYIERAVQLAPNNPAAYKDLGVVYGMKKQYAKTLEVLQKALLLDPNDVQIYQNLIITYNILGQKDKANEMLTKIKMKH